MQIIELVITCRDKLGSNVKLAKHLKVELHAVRRWIIGQHEPRLNTIRLLEKLISEGKP